MTAKRMATPKPMIPPMSRTSVVRYLPILHTLVAHGGIGVGAIAVR